MGGVFANATRSLAMKARSISAPASPRPSACPLFPERSWAGRSTLSHLRPRKRSSEHWVSALGLLLGRLVLDHIPVLDQNAVLDADNVGSNPVHRLAEARESAVHDHELFFGNYRSRFVLQCGRHTLDEIEQTLPTRRDMGAVLDVVRGPVGLGRSIVPFVEQCVEGLQNKRLIFLLRGLD